MKLAIKSMVCPRCIATVARAAEDAGLTPRAVALGEIELQEDPAPPQLADFRARLETHGFAIVESDKARLINQIKSLLIDRARHGGERGALKLSAYLSQKLNYEYGHLSKLFSSVEAMTIERFATAQRIERAKELISYGERSIAEIADDLGYSSPAHLSGQFKRETGMTPSEFRKLKAPIRRSLDAL